MIEWTDRSRTLLGGVFDALVDVATGQIKREIGLPERADPRAALPPPTDFAGAAAGAAAAHGLVVVKAGTGFALLAPPNGHGPDGRVAVTIDAGTVSVVALNGLGFPHGLPTELPTALLARNPNLGRLAWGVRTYDGGEPFLECRGVTPAAGMTAAALAALLGEVRAEATALRHALARAGLLH